MIEELAERVIELKKEFTKIYKGNSHIQEIIPISKTDDFPIKKDHLTKLHEFAEKNPIYYNSFELDINEIPCKVYEGDINEYWLNSISHGSSYQPFYPTWILSAYIMSLMAKTLGYKQVLDIGSGDGRIAYCSKILGLEAISIEVDESLVDLQKKISLATNLNFKPKCADAVEFNYSSLKLTNPVFFIGGLAQMGGDVLASSIIEKINIFSDLKKNIGMTFAGTYSKKYFPGTLSDNMSEGGWKPIIEKYKMSVSKTIILPTVWTFDQPIDTPYIFTKFN